MSLIHWWPLNGDAKDYGIEGSNSGSFSGIPTFVNGKIGKCAECNSSHYPILPYTCETTDEFTIAFWVKIPSAMASNTDWETVLYYSGIDDESEILVSYNWTSYQNLKIPDTTHHQYWWLSPSSNFSYDNWFHLTLVHSNNGKQKTQCYINGILLGEVNNVTQALKIRSGNIALGQYVTVGSIYFNDVRIYDHALSAKEVKEISKGLVLHYNFEDPYAEGTTNLITQAITDGGWYWSGSATVTNTIVNADNSSLPFKQCRKSIYNISETVGGTYDTLQNLVPVQGSTLYAYSVYIKTNLPFSPNMLYRYEYDSNNGYITEQGIASESSIEDLGSGWYRYFGTFTTQSNTAKITFQTFNYPSQTGEFYRYIGGAQVERKDHTTPYVLGTRPNGTIYDNSGYGYNGTQNGNLQILEDSPSGEKSAKFNSNIYVDIPTLPEFAEVSYAFWIKIPTATDAYRSIFNVKENPTGGLWLSLNTEGQGLWSYYASSPSYSGISGFISADTWIHCVFVFKDGYANWYKNGEYMGRDVYYPNLPKIPSNHYCLGDSYTGSSWDGTPFDGQVADFKIYATALSANDILAEYNRKASIDRNGNLFSGEFVAENGKTNISKTGVVESSHFVEGTSVVKLVDGYTELEYIGSTGTQYINTAVPVADDFEFVLDQMSNLDTGNHYLCGSSTSGRMLGTLSNGLWSNVVVASGIAVGKEVRQTIGCHIVANGSSGSDYVMTNYTLGTSQSGHSSYSTSSSSNTVCLFRVNGMSSSESFTCYDFKVFSLGVMVAHLIPAKRNKDNVIGMYDTVNRVFYTNSGTGTFTAGPEKGNLSIVYSNELKEC